MITRFKYFLNEDIGEDIRKNLSDRINKAFDNIRLKYPKKDEPKPKSKSEPIEPPKEPPKIEGPRDLRLKSIKVKGLEDKRLADALIALKGMGFDEKRVEAFLKNIEEIYPETTTEDIIRFGMKHLSKF